MNSCEALVARYLAHQGYVDVVYEPDGNIPPDFLVDGKVAIEVRRLNQHHDSGDGNRGLEEVAIPLWQRVENLVKSLGAPVNGESWFVMFGFSRPVESWSTLGPALATALSAFRDAPSRVAGRVFERDGFSLDVVKASEPHAMAFLMGGNLDFQSGGFIVSEMIRNIHHCLAEKSRKVARVRPKYDQWWLALTDHIGLGLDAVNIEQLLSHIQTPLDWDKVVIIDPRDPTRAFEF